MALLLEGIVSPEEIKATPANKEMMDAMVQINREVIARYGPILLPQVSDHREFVATLATLTAIEYFLRKRAAERIN